MWVATVEPRVLTRPSHRTGYTLVELIFAITGASLLMVGLASSLFLALRASDTSDTSTAATTSGSAALTDLLSDIEFAMSFSEQSANAITFTVPDRDGDSNPETIRFAWSGTPGDPLTYQYNGGTEQIVLADVHVFQHDLPTPAPNLLSNAGMESGTTNWQAISGCTITHYSDPVFSGSGAIGAWRNSPSDNAGLQQDVAGQISSGVTYELSAWLLKWASGTPDDVKLQLRIDSSGEGVQEFSIDPVNVPVQSWIPSKGSVTPSWSGTLNSAHWQAIGVTNFKDLHVDDVALRVANAHRQHVNVSLQVGSDSRALVQSGAWLKNSPL